MSYSKVIVINVVLFVSIIFTIAFFLEIYARLAKPRISEFDDQLGWMIKENIDRTFSQKRYSGDNYEVIYRTNELGLRANIKETSDATILVLGDSFTAGPYASNNEMWFSAFTKLLESKIRKDISIIAGGDGAWGTYQSFLLAEKILEKIEPDVFILQFCSNDYGNNLYDWESITSSTNHYFNRPYPELINNKLFSFRDNSIRARLYRAFFNNSRVLSKVQSLIQIYLSTHSNIYNPKISCKK